MIVLAWLSVGAAALAVDGASQFGGTEEDRTFRGEVPATLPRNPVICGWEEGSRPRLTIVATGEVVPLARRVSAGCHGAEELLPPGVLVAVGGAVAVVSPVVDDTAPVIVGRAVRLRGGRPGEEFSYIRGVPGESGPISDTYLVACVWDSSPVWAAAAPLGAPPESWPPEAGWWLQEGSGNRMVVRRLNDDEGAMPGVLLIRDAAGNVVSAPAVYGGWIEDDYWGDAGRSCLEGEATRGWRGDHGWW